MDSFSCHNTPPLVSVIIPSGDSHRTIKAAIDSVLNQTYPRIETIVVLNGECGTTPDIISAYTGIKILSIGQPNAYIARQYGAEHSSGDFIMFLDADDLLHKRAVTEAVNAIMGSSADIVQMKLTQFATKYHMTLRWKFPCHYDSLNAFKGIISDTSLYNPGISAKLYRRQTLMPFPHIGYSGFWGEDRLCNMHIFSRHPVATYAPSSIYYYRYGGASRDMTRKGLQEEIHKVHQLKIDFLETNNLRHFIHDAEKEYVDLCKIISRYHNPPVALKIKMCISKLLSQ